MVEVPDLHWARRKDALINQLAESSLTGEGEV
jgi:hypothetical protein